MCDTGSELEQRGEYEAAAATYARTGFARLIRAKFELNGVTRMGVGALLQAISADRRAGTQRRPTHLGAICRPLLEEIRETTEDTILAGLATEWLGDLALMLGEDGALDHYNTAKEQFEGMDWQDERWRDEPELVFAYLAIRRFSDYHDGLLPETEDTMTFQVRLDRKRALVQQLSGCTNDDDS